MHSGSLVILGAVPFRVPLPRQFRLALEGAFRSFRPSFHRASLVGLFKDRLSIDMGSLRPLLRTSLVGVGHIRESASAHHCQMTGPVPPSRFLAALMVCSAGCLAGLLHPAADPGVRRVSSRLSGVLADSGPRALLADALALRSFSFARSRSPFGVSCPLAVRRPGDRSVRLQGVAPQVESVASRRCCHCL